MRRFKTFFAFAGACFFLFAAAFSFGAEKEAQASPSAFLPEIHYKFAPVADGVEIMHDFIIQNKGRAPLKIIKVGTG